MGVAVVIPTHKEKLHWFEAVSFERLRFVLRKFPIIFAVPNGSNFSYVKESGLPKIEFPASCFASGVAYNLMMMNARFYEAFSSYEYILIAQLDAFIFSDQLEYFCNLGYDYIGAPWPVWNGHQGRNLFLHVGNGGLSLRKVKACQQLLSSRQDLIKAWNRPAEDCFFAYASRMDNNFHVAPISVAFKFACEWDAARCVRKNGGSLPFGCHGWQRYSADFYQNALSLFGYDIKPYRYLMTSDDLDRQPLLLERFAFSRLANRIQHGRTVSHYLPKGKKYWGICRGEQSKVLLQCLEKEGYRLSNSKDIRQYGDNEDAAIIQEMCSVRRPYLLIDIGSSNLIKALEAGGLIYGRDFISFWQEYIQHSQTLLKNISKGKRGAKI